MSGFGIIARPAFFFYKSSWRYNHGFNQQKMSVVCILAKKVVPLHAK